MLSPFWDIGGLKENSQTHIERMFGPSAPARLLRCGKLTHHPFLTICRVPEINVCVILRKEYCRRLWRWCTTAIKETFAGTGNKMRVCVTEHRDLSPLDLRPTGELAPSLALPWIAKLRDGVLMGQVSLILLAHFLFHIELPLGWMAIPLAVTAASNVSCTAS